MFSTLRKTVAASAVIATLLSIAPAAMAPTPVIPEPAISYPSGPTTRDLTADQRNSLIAKLEKAKEHDQQARAGWSQEVLVQADYDSKTAQIDRIVSGLQKGDDYLLSDINDAMTSPGTAPY